MTASKFALRISTTMNKAGGMEVSQSLVPVAGSGLPELEFQLTVAGVPTMWGSAMREAGLSNHDVAAVQVAVEAMRRAVLEELQGGAI